MRGFLFFLLTVLQVYTPVYGQQATGKVVEGTLFPGIIHLRNFTKNQGAEKNILNLTTSASIVTRSTSTPLQGTASFAIDGTSSGQTVKFDADTLENLLSYQNCEARFNYSGDASLYKAYVEQGSTKVTTDLTLLNSTGTQSASIPFACGDLSSNSHLVIETTSASAAAIKVDNVYLGAATSLGTVAQSKNVVQFVWTGSLSATHTGDILYTWSGATQTRLQNFSHSSGVFTATVPGDYQYKFCARLDYTSGSASTMREIMAKAYKNSSSTPLESGIGGYVFGIAQNNINNGGESPSGTLGFPPPCVTGTVSLAFNDTLRFKAYQANGSGSTFNWIAGSLEINYFPTSSDQTYKIDCGTTGSCVNTFSLQFSSSCVVSQENVDWVNGNGVNSTGICDFTFNTGFFTQAPNCIVMAQAALFPFTNGAASTTTVQTRTYNAAGTNTAAAGTLICHRQGSDIRPNINAPLVVGSVTTTAPSLMRVEWARITQSAGTYTLAASSSGVASITKNAAADISLNFSPSFTLEPVCTATPESGCLVTSANPAHSVSSYRFNMYTSNFGAACETAMYVTCMGAK
jgi:hypothetical protein